MAIVVEAATEVTPELVAALASLFPQLTTRRAPPSAEHLGRIVASSTSTLLVVRDDGDTIVGMLTLVVYAIPSGVRARIEDVVVDASARGRGVGAMLVTEALRLAAQDGAEQVELTSAPTREAANRLYQRLGFERRETNVYRYYYKK